MMENFKVWCIECVDAECDERIDAKVGKYLAQIIAIDYEFEARRFAMNRDSEAWRSALKTDSDTWKTKIEAESEAMIAVIEADLGARQTARDVEWKDIDEEEQMEHEEDFRAARYAELEARYSARYAERTALHAATEAERETHSKARKAELEVKADAIEAKLKAWSRVQKLESDPAGAIARKVERDAVNSVVKDASFADIGTKLKVSRAAIDSQLGAWLVAVESEWKDSCAAVDAKLEAQRAAIETEVRASRAAVDVELRASRAALDAELEASRADIDAAFGRYGKEAWKIEWEVAFDEESRKSDQAVECAICIEDFDHQVGIGAQLRCNHRYHTSCLKTWIERRRKRTCPLCRHPI